MSRKAKKEILDTSRLPEVYLLYRMCHLVDKLVWEIPLPSMQIISRATHLEGQMRRLSHKGEGQNLSIAKRNSTESR